MYLDSAAEMVYGTYRLACGLGRIKKEEEDALYGDSCGFVWSDLVP
jgi:hypothetical protein